MNDPAQLPRRYFVDETGRRVLIGLTIEETFEFETIDDLPALDVAWNEDGLPNSRQQRWRELYTKHDRAWRQWMVETSADRLGNSTFVN